MLGENTRWLEGNCLAQVTFGKIRTATCMLQRLVSEISVVDVTQLLFPLYYNYVISWFGFELQLKQQKCKCVKVNTELFV